MKGPLIINDRDKIEAAYAASLQYLGEQIELQEKITDALLAYHEIGSLIPQTATNVLSGHYLPYSESYLDLESSLQLCMEGFYKYAFMALRSVLELGILGVNFAADDREHEEVRPWLASQTRIRFKKTLKRIERLNNFEKFDDRFGLSKRIETTYDSMCAFVHTRGYLHTSQGIAGSNYNRFSTKSFNRYCEVMPSVVSDVIIVLLLKYPIGLQSLPLFEKFGLNGPAGGFLDSDEVESITAILHPEERNFLKQLSDNDPNVRSIKEQIESMPDISEEELKRQSNELYMEMKISEPGMKNRDRDKSLN